MCMTKHGENKMIIVHSAHSYHSNTNTLFIHFAGLGVGLSDMC